LTDRAIRETSAPGWQVEEGAIRTRQLQEIFSSYFGWPEHITLVGEGEVSLIAPEKSSELLDATFLMDGLVGVSGPGGG
jgi:hypothetical protein